MPPSSASGSNAWRLFKSNAVKVQLRSILPNMALTQLSCHGQVFTKQTRMGMHRYTVLKHTGWAIILAAPCGRSVLTLTPAYVKPLVHTRVGGCDARHSTLSVQRSSSVRRVCMWRRPLPLWFLS